MDIVLVGGGVRMVQGMMSAIPTLVVGLCISAVLRYYLGISGTLRLFGGVGWRLGSVMAGRHAIAGLFDWRHSDH